MSTHIVITGNIIAEARGLYEEVDPALYEKHGTDWVCRVEGDNREIWDGSKGWVKTGETGLPDAGDANGHEYTPIDSSTTGTAVVLVPFRVVKNVNTGTANWSEAATWDKGVPQDGDVVVTDTDSRVNIDIDTAELFGAFQVAGSDFQMADNTTIKAREFEAQEGNFLYPEATLGNSATVKGNATGKTFAVRHGSGGGTSRLFGRFDGYSTASDNRCIFFDDVGRMEITGSLHVGTGGSSAHAIRKAGVGDLVFVGNAYGNQAIDLNIADAKLFCHYQNYIEHGAIHGSGAANLIVAGLPDSYNKLRFTGVFGTLILKRDDNYDGDWDFNAGTGQPPTDTDKYPVWKLGADWEYTFDPAKMKWVLHEIDSSDKWESVNTMPIIGTLENDPGTGAPPGTTVEVNAPVEKVVYVNRNGSLRVVVKDDKPLIKYEFEEIITDPYEDPYEEGMEGGGEGGIEI